MDVIDIPNAARTLERLGRAHDWSAEVVVRDGRWNDSDLSQCLVRLGRGRERVVAQWIYNHDSVAPAWKAVSCYTAEIREGRKLYPTRVPSVEARRWVKLTDRERLDARAVTESERAA